MVSFATAESVQELKEPVFRQVPVNMTTTGERELITRGDVVYMFFLRSLAVGTTSFEVRINDQWITLVEGDRLKMGDCHPTRVGILVRTQPALAGLFSQVIISATPDSDVERP